MLQKKTKGLEKTKGGEILGTSPTWDVSCWSALIMMAHTKVGRVPGGRLEVGFALGRGTNIVAIQSLYFKFLLNIKINLFMNLIFGYQSICDASMHCPTVTWGPNLQSEIRVLYIYRNYTDCQGLEGPGNSPNILFQTHFLRQHLSRLSEP